MKNFSKLRVTITNFGTTVYTSLKTFVCLQYNIYILRNILLSHLTIVVVLILSIK